jgi:plastocyanin
MREEISLMRTTTRSKAAVAAALVAVTLLCFPAQAAGTDIVIQQFSFSPQRLSVKAGTTVTWINQDDTPHIVASSTKLFKSKALDTTDKFSFTFTTPGTYEYFCSLHPHMSGTVVVETTTGSHQMQ